MSDTYNDLIPVIGVHGYRSLPDLIADPSVRIVPPGNLAFSGSETNAASGRSKRNGVNALISNGVLYSPSEEGSVLECEWTAVGYALARAHIMAKKMDTRSSELRFHLFTFLADLTPDHRAWLTSLPTGFSAPSGQKIMLDLGIISRRSRTGKLVRGPSFPTAALLEFYMEHPHMIPAEPSIMQADQKILAEDIRDRAPLFTFLRSYWSKPEDDEPSFSDDDANFGNIWSDIL